jgi:hypothetical protein
VPLVAKPIVLRDYELIEFRGLLPAPISDTSNDEIDATESDQLSYSDSHTSLSAFLFLESRRKQFIC